MVPAEMRLTDATTHVDTKTSTLGRPLAVTLSQGLMVSYSIQPVTVQRAGFAPVPAMYR